MNQIHHPFFYLCIIKISNKSRLSDKKPGFRLTMSLSATSCTSLHCTLKSYKLEISLGGIFNH